MAFSDPVVRVTTRVSIGAVYFGALYVMEAQGSLTPRRHGRSVRGTTTSVPHAPRAPLILTLTLSLSLSLALTLQTNLHYVTDDVAEPISVTVGPGGDE